MSPILSVCIPTYNRGSSALRAVMHILSREYAKEIELIVSNNGSTEEREAYKKIRDLDDSRLRYYELEENQGYASNVYNCLQNANGHFVMLLSDEDAIVHDNFDVFLDYLANHMDLAGIVTNDFSGDIVRNEYKTFNRGIEAIIWSLHTNYASGCCYNVEYLRGNSVFEKFMLLRGNAFFEDYTHCAMFALLALDFNMTALDIGVWQKVEQRSTGGMPINKASGLAEYAIPERRMIQEKDTLLFLLPFLDSESFVQVLCDRINAIFAMVSGAFLVSPDAIKIYCSWLELWKLHYKNCMKIIQDATSHFEISDTARMEIDKVFLSWLDCRRIRKLTGAEESLKATLRAQIVEYLYALNGSLLEIDYESIDQNISQLIESTVNHSITVM